jgi:hypothetical protein
VLKDICFRARSAKLHFPRCSARYSLELPRPDDRRCDDHTMPGGTQSLLCRVSVPKICQIKLYSTPLTLLQSVLGKQCSWSARVAACATQHRMYRTWKWDADYVCTARSRNKGSARIHDKEPLIHDCTRSRLTRSECHGTVSVDRHSSSGLKPLHVSSQSQHSCARNSVKENEDNGQNQFSGRCLSQTCVPAVR